MADTKLEEPEGRGKAKGGPRDRLNAPAKITSDDVLKAIRVVNDKGGRGKPRDLVEVFGGAKKRDFLVRSLGLLAQLGFLTKDAAAFTIEEEGRRFLAANEEDQKSIFGRRLISFQPYRDVLMRLNNEKERSLRKGTITEMWSNIAGGGGRVIREAMTKTFASLTSYAGLTEDSGMTLTITGPSVSLLQLSEVPSQEADVGKTATPTEPPSLSVSGLSIPELICPKCKSRDVGVVDEDAMQYFKSDRQTVAFVKYKLFCRACKETFSRHGQQIVQGQQL
jgi:hypothetical protein